MTRSLPRAETQEAGGLGMPAKVYLADGRVLRRRIAHPRVHDTKVMPGSSSRG